MTEIAGQQLHDILSRNGIDQYSFLKISEIPQSLRREHSLGYGRWIGGGMHGEMEYLARHAPLKYDPKRIVSSAETLLFLILPYYQNSTGAADTRTTGLVSRYAWGRDYHKVLKKKIKAVTGDLRRTFPGEEFRGFVDSGPLDERVFAEFARLGHIGRNGLLIHPRWGSWIFIGEIFMSIWVAGDSAAEMQPAGKCPERCRACIRSCPTGALIGDGGFDARRCISYLTIEQKGAIPVEYRSLIGDRIFGCDRCQEICPLNTNVAVTPETDLIRHIAGVSIDIEKILSLRSRDQMEQLFAGSPLMRLSVFQLLRNALIVAGNSGNRALIPQVKILAADENDILAEHAGWALSQLEN